MASTNHHAAQQQSLSSFLYNPTRHRQRQRRHALSQQQQQAVVVDGTFNNVPLTLKTITVDKLLNNNKHPPTSSIHCVGENFGDNAWQQRSCHFTFFCFNTSAKDYVVFQSQQEQEMQGYQSAVTERPHLSTVLEQQHKHSSNGNSNKTSLVLSVSLGGINLRWGIKEMQRLEWFPKVIPIHNNDSNNNMTFTYYELPPHIVMVPFHSMSGSNPGHLIWDDFLPIYTLLDMFGLHSSSSGGGGDNNNIGNHEDHYFDDDYDILPMRHVLHDGKPPLWASCDDKIADCEKMMRKFLPLLVGKDCPYRVSSTRDFDFQPSNNGPSAASSDLICARHGVAGIGSLTDHGVAKMHGWEKQDYETTHNHGRGGLLYRFRNFCLDNMGLVLHRQISLHHHQQQRQQQQRRHLIVFSQNSSHQGKRNTNFAEQMKWISKSVPQAQVQGHVFYNLTLVEQLEIVTKTSILVSFSGGGAVTAMFLPRGACVILFYSKYRKKTLTTTTTNNSSLEQERTDAYLDWDLFNSLSHLRVHWLHRSLLDNRQVLIRIIQHEIQWMESSPS